MIIEVAGNKYTGWTKAGAEIAMDRLCRKFSFTATSKSGRPLPFRGGESCRVFVDGELVITGHIEIVDVSGDSAEHSIDISGRDRTGDVLDSKIASISDIRPPITLKIIIEKLLAHIESPVRVIEQFEPRIFVDSQDLAAPESGQGVWDFIEDLARVRQVLLTSSPFGNIVIARASGTRINATLQNKIDSDTNNVLSYSVSYDTTGVYRFYKMSSQLVPAATNKAGSVSNYTLAEQIATIKDVGVRAGRQHVMEAEHAGNIAERVKWEYNVRQARSMVYSATVNGYKNQTGEIWKPNQVINVNDEYAGINARMLVNGTKFSMSEAGKQTSLSLVHQNAYTLSLTPTVSQIDALGTGLSEVEARYLLGDIIL